MSRLTTLAALVLVAGGAAAEETDGASRLRNDTGRLATRLAGVEQISGQLPSTEADTLSEAARLDLELRATVFRYNAQRAQMCARRQLAHLSCGAAYLPAWMLEAPEAAPSMKVLEERRAAVEGHVVPLWRAVCETTRRVAKLIVTGDHCFAE
jgi:hypothetical protein